MARYFTSWRRVK